jgi:hypothetical protein
MKWILGVAVSFLMVLVVGIVFIHRASSPPASMQMRASIPLPISEAPALALAAAADRENEVTSAVTNNARTAEILSQDLATLRKEVARLSEQITAFDLWRRTPSRTATEVSHGREPESAPDPRSEPATRTTVARERQHQMMVVEANFRQEPADSRWAFEAEAAIQEAIANDNMGQNTLLDLECRAQTCRVELAATDPGEFAKAIPLVLLQLAPTLPHSTMHYSTDNAGGNTIIMYLTREAPLPPVRRESEGFFR